MATSRTLAVTLLAVMLGGTAAVAADLVGVPGSSTQFPAAKDATIDGQSVSMVLTGCALRQKYFFNVYAVAGYVSEASAARTAEELAAADCPKRLELVMERAVEGKEMAEAFRAAIRQNYPSPAFDREVGDLVQFLQGQTARKGDHIVLTHVPGAGLHCDLNGRAEVLIKTPQFSRAVWDIYLGRNNLGEEIKKGLVSRR